MFAALTLSSAAFASHNDYFDYPQLLPEMAGATSDANTSASKESGEPNHAGDPGGHSLWYRWTPTASGSATLATTGSDFDTLLAVYTGRRVSRLTPIAANDDDPLGTEPGTSRLTFQATAGVEYQIAVDGKGGATGSFRLSYNQPPPRNDSLTGAQPISGSSGSVTGTTLYATSEPDPGRWRGWDESDASVWYRWSAPSPAQTTFDTSGGATNPYIQVYVGSSLATLDAYDVYWDVSAVGYRRIILWPRTGETYYIRIAGQMGTSWGGFALNWQPTTPPLNDEFARAQIIPGTPGSVQGTNVGASSEPGEPAHSPEGWGGGTSVWYRWTAPATGSITFDATGSRGDVVTAAYTGTELGSLVQVARDEYMRGAVGFVATGGTTYSIAVEGRFLQVGDVLLTWRWNPPPNDPFHSRERFLSENRATRNGYTTAATADPGEPAHAGHAARHSIWYELIWGIDGDVVIDTHGSSFDTVLAVYVAPKFEYPREPLVNELIPLASNDDDGTRRTSTVRVRVGGHHELYVAVDGRNGAFGATVLNWSYTPAPPPNDNFANAQPLGGQDGEVHGRTLAATKEYGEPNHAGVPGGRSIWYRWTSPVNGRASFWTFPVMGLGDWGATSVNTLLAVYRGSSLTALTPVAANNDYPLVGGTSRVHFPVAKGLVYHVAVDAVAAAQGNVRLRWTTPPLNDELEHAQVIAARAGTETGTTLRSTTQAYEQDFPGGQSVWYLWTAPLSEAVRFTADSSSFAPHVEVYTGIHMDKLERVPLTGEETSDERFRFRFRAVAGTLYRIRVRSDSWGPFSLDWGPASAPANDNFRNAQAIGGESGIARGHNLEATNEVDEPRHHEDYGGFRTLWYAYTAPVNGTMSFDTAGSDYPAVVAVYAGTDVARLTKITAYHNGVDQLRTRVRVGVQAGATYRIAVGTAGGYSSLGGNLVLNWRRAAAPSNDNWASYRPLAGSAGTVTASNVEASKEAGEPRHGGDPGGASIWFRWTAPATGVVSFDTFGSTLNTLVGVYQGNSVASLTRLRSNDNAAIGVTTSRLALPVTAGVTYQIALDTVNAGYIDINGLTGEMRLNWRLPAAPVNDSFAMAQPLNPDTYAGYRIYLDVDDNRGATKEPGEPNHAGVAGGRSIWYRWTAPTSGGFTIHTRGSTFDTLLAVYTGSALDALTEVASDDNAGEGGTSRVDFTATEGVTYWIAVDGRSGATGDLALSVNLALVPANDHFRAAKVIGGSRGTTPGSNYGASHERGEPVHAFWGNDSSVWYRWTAPAAGTFAFTVVESSVDAVVAVYTGPGLENLTLLTDTEGRTARLGAVPGMTYHIAVDAFGSPGSFELAWQPAAAPANDNFATPVYLSGTAGTVTGSTMGASPQAQEQAHAGKRGGASIWYRWAAPANGTLTVDTAGSTFDTTLAVYAGSSLPGLVAKGVNDDAGTARTSRVRLPVWAGWLYRFAVDSHNGGLFVADAPSGSVRLTWSFQAPPANDLFAAGRAISGTSGSVSGTNLGARKEPGEPRHADAEGGASVWYRWTAPASGTVTFSTGRSGFPSLLGIYTGSTVDGLAVVRRSDDTVVLTRTISFAARAGFLYRIAVDGAGGATGTVVLDWRMAPPANDGFAYATAIGGRSGTVRGSNATATREAGEPAHAGLAGGRSIWYRWTAPASESITLSTVGSTFNTLLAVYTGSSVGALSRVAANDNAPGFVTSVAKFEAVAGRVYSIAVDGYAGASGTVALTWHPTPDPPNNFFVEAERIVGRTGGVGGTTFDANREPAEPNHAGGNGQHSVWYRWTAPGEGTATLWTDDIRFDTVLAVYTGTAVNALSLVAQDNNSGAGGGRSRVSFTVAAGREYRIAVDGVGSSMGAFGLFWNLPPLNDHFTAAQPLAGAPGTVAGTTIGATAEQGEPDHAGRRAQYSVWYRWSAPADGTMAFQVTDSSEKFDPVIGIYVGDRLESLGHAGGNWGAVRIPVFAGTVYRIAIDGYGIPADFTLAWRPTTAPPNDNFNNAMMISGTSGTIRGSNVGATREIGEPSHYDTAGRTSVWYRWTAPASGTVGFDTQGSAFWTVLAVYRGSSVDSLTEVGANAGYWGDRASQVTFSASGGSTYYIAVDSTGGEGELVLNWIQP